jgi:hypothetical protein
MNTVPGALPVPESIQTIPDVSFRQQATEAWRAASQLRRLMIQWTAWFHQLESKGDADPGLALRMSEAVAICVQALCALGVDMPTFNGAECAELLQRFPREPWAILDPPWQRDEEYRRQTSELLRSDDWDPLMGELLGFIQLLEIAPSTAFGVRPSPVGGKRPGAGRASDKPPASPGTELIEREKEILHSLLHLKAEGERRRVSRDQAARKADPASKASSYYQAIASLARKGLICSRRGPNGGLWLTPEGVSAAKLLTTPPAG